MGRGGLLRVTIWPWRVERETPIFGRAALLAFFMLNLEVTVGNVLQFWYKIIFVEDDDEVGRLVYIFTLL
jgi:hypothetical protein